MQKDPDSNKGRNQLSTPRHVFFLYGSSSSIIACNWSKEEEVALLIYKLPEINEVFESVGMLLEYKYIKHKTEVWSLDYWSTPNNNNLSSTLLHLYSNTCEPTGC